MKKQIAWIALFAACVFIIGTGAANAQLNSLFIPDTPAVCEPVVWDLTAGQHNNVGTVEVTNDSTYLYVTYNLTWPDATFGTLHVWAGNDLSSIPTNPQGIPVPGQFPYQHNAAGLTSYTFEIPLASLNAVDAYGKPVCDLSLYVFTHAEVYMDSDGDGCKEWETAWGGDHPVNVGDPGRWYFFGQYTICCGDFPPPPVCWSETAFAKGTHVFASTTKANPEGLLSLDLTKQRWGWAINLTQPVTEQEYPIYAGAGLNDTTKGVEVGTLYVTWDGSSATVRYSLLPDYKLQEVHLYASDLKPTKIAPGRYGIARYYDAGASGDTFSVQTLTDTNSDGVWIIGHAVVSKGTCPEGALNSAEINRTPVRQTGAAPAPQLVQKPVTAPAPPVLNELRAVPVRR